LSRDREVIKRADGTLETRDDSNFEIAFRITKRRKLDLPAELINSPGAKPGRGPNVIAARQDAEAKPRTLSHIVYFTPEMEKMSKFYIERLKFVVTDQFTNTGPFLRPMSNDDHHVLFMIQTPDYMQGLEHLAFHMQGPTELMLAGSRMVQKGYESFWGPGRHKFGSNWFWYFNSPLGTHVEYDADMDKHDGEWVHRETAMSKEAAQLFLFENVEKWAPGGPPPGAGTD
jgi:catechol-2,3-dioxygenase